MSKPRKHSSRSAEIERGLHRLPGSRVLLCGVEYPRRQFYNEG